MLKTNYVIQGGVYRSHRYLGSQVVATFTMPDGSIRSIVIDEDLLEDILDQVGEELDTFDIEYDETFESNNDFVYRMVLVATGNNKNRFHSFTCGGKGPMYKAYKKKFEQHKGDSDHPPVSLSDANW